jgi:signal transduction histidine kinase
MGFFSKKQSPTPNNNSFAEAALFSIQEGVIITDSSLRVRFINPAALALSGNTNITDVTNLSYDSVLRVTKLTGEPFADQENLLAHAIVTGQQLDNFRALTSAGVPISVSVAISSDASRIVTLRNIKKELAEEENKDDFISTASHEMRTPVATIKGYLELCLNPETATVDERARGYLESAHHASEHLGRLFQDLLDATKLEDGHSTARPVPTEMVSLTQQVVAEFQPKATAKRQNIVFGSRESAASTSHVINQVVYGYVDTDFYRLILSNLLENAIKYTPEDGSIYVNVAGEDDRIRLTIADTGIGISPTDLPHIFQKFYRVDNSDTRTIGGTGLGLYLAKKRVEALGGSIFAESVVGSGSTFTVILPRLSKDQYEKLMINVKGETK